jgi:AraC-like DNA-binding protein
VLEGSFIYRGDTGRALFHPGSFVLGNNEKCFECGHDHSRGDRCLSFGYSGALFEEIALAATGSMRYKFRTPMLPVAPEMMPLLADIEAASHMRAEEITASVASTVLRAMSGHIPNPVAVSAADERRICDVVRHIERHSDEPLKLEDLAQLTRMSKFHFLRTFRRAVGLSPYQFLLNQRMRAAARRLAASHEAVSTIALEAGFGDLSTFNSRFRTTFDMSPTQYRRLRRGP